MTLLIALSCLISLVTTPLASRLASRSGLVDRPASRKFHGKPTPLLGGLALWLAILIPLALTWGELPGARLSAFALAASLLFLAGLYDDWRHLAVGAKLVVQISAAVLLVAGGFRFELPLAEPLVLLVSFLWIVGITNAFNLLDNMDGAAAGVAAVAAAGFLILVSGSPTALALAATILGATLGFLPYNFHPARLFMGDAGSHVLGLGLAAVGLEVQLASSASGFEWMLPVLILAVPIFDTTLVSVSRLRQGKNPMTHPGKDHFAHRLVRQGLGVRAAVLTLYAIGALAIVLAGLIREGGPDVAWWIGGFAVLGVMGGMAWLERPALPDL